MNRRYSALALTALAMGAVVLTATEASAMLKDPEPGSAATTGEAYEWPDEGSGYPASGTKSPEYNYPNYDPRYEVARTPAETVSGSSEETWVNIARFGGSALGGAGAALGGVWLYRRRQLATA